MKIYVRAATADILSESPEIQLRIAQNSCTRPNVLSKLYHNNPDEDMVLAIANNPNTPDDIVIELSRNDSRAIASCLIARGNLPDVAWNNLLSHPNQFVIPQMASSNTTPPEILRKISERTDIDIYTVDDIIDNPNTPKDVLDHYLSEDPVLCKLNGITPVADHRDMVHGHIIQTTTSPDILRKIAGMYDVNDSNFYYIASRLVANPYTPDDVLYDLANSGDLSLLEDLAQSANTPVALLRELVNSDYAAIRSYAACNRYLSKEDYLKLARDPDLQVRLALANNRSIPASIFKILAKDKSIKVRTQVAHNLNTPVNILRELAQDTSSTVRSAAEMSLQKLIMRQA